MTDTMRYEIRSVGVIRPLAWTDDYDLAVAICLRLGVDTRDGRLLYVFGRGGPAHGSWLPLPLITANTPGLLGN